MIHIKQIYREDYPENKKSIFYYKSNCFYDVEIKTKTQNDGWIIDITKKPFTEPFIRNIEGFVFETKVNFDKEEYYVALNDENIELGYICVIYQKWHNLARLWDIEVNEKFRRQGIGKILLDFMEERARDWKCRAIGIECQSSNYPAISFYRKNGYNFTGADIIAYSNDDIKKCEVKFEMSKKLE
ncbi:MAG: GNAT family N-acetyltransferase [Candidatus Hermodarchaeota archaeon]